MSLDTGISLQYIGLQQIYRDGHEQCPNKGVLQDSIRQQHPWLPQQFPGRAIGPQQ